MRTIHWLLHFRLHEFDNDTMLDGLELFKALTHLLPYEELEGDLKKKIDTNGKTPEQIREEEKMIRTKYYAGTLIRSLIMTIFL